MDPWLATMLALAALVALVALASGRVRRAARPAPRERGGRAAPQVVYTQHATARMAERGISREQLEHVVAAPHRQSFDSTQHSVRLERDFGNDVLKVWVVPPWPASGEAVVKSTAWRITRRFELGPGDARRIIGPGGATVRSLQAKTGTRISIRRDGAVEISGGSEQAVMRALAEVRAIA